jgi:S-adenosylmethionine synthetase
MIKTSEYVSLGHPDKTADYISCYLLDRFLEKDPKTRFAVEVMLKDNIVTLGGEVTSKANFSDEEITQFVRAAVNEVGYTREYQNKWGKENAICGDDLQVTAYIGRQSDGIGQGVSRDAWGDQGIFHGMAVNCPDYGDMPKDYSLAKTLARQLYKSGLGGLDIKTLVATDNGCVSHVTVAIPMLLGCDNTTEILDIIKKTTGCPQIILNGTGNYVSHSSIADCGVTGRKLAVDFYGGNCRIGGGSPWTKDPTKADLTLNVYARKKALEAMERFGLELCHVAVACCIGRRDITVTVFDGITNRQVADWTESRPASEVIAELGLDKPVYADKCRRGLFA